MNDDDIGMVRSKEEFMRGLEACQKADCDHCPYDDIGCSPVLAYDALVFIKDQNERIKRLLEDAKILCDALNEKEEDDGIF